MRRLCFLIVLTIFALPAAAQDSPWAGNDPTQALQQYRDELADITERGRLIYRYDQAAWATTDELLRHRTREQMLEVRGWVVEEEGDGLRVTYFGLEDEEPYVFASYLYLNGGIAGGGIAEHGTRRALSPGAHRLALAHGAAVQFAYENQIGICAQALPNTVIVPNGANGVSVYFLTPQTHIGAYPVGGHVRFDLNAESSVREWRQFTNTCIEADFRQVPENRMPAFYVVGHLLVPHPTEIHVWLSSWMNVPVVVLTSSSALLWRVDHEAISIFGYVDGEGQVQQLDR